MVKKAAIAKDEGFNFADTMSRLSDDKGIVKDSALLRKMRERISLATTRMGMKPQKGGNPFVFVVMSDKMHYIRDDIPTAATDGKAFYWSPNILEALVEQPISKIMAIQRHEVYHVVFFHCLESRRAGRRMDVWAMIIDWMVNATVEKEVKEAKPEDHKDLWDLALPWERIEATDVQTGRRIVLSQDDARKKALAGQISDLKEVERDANGKLYVEKVAPCSIDMYLDYIAAKTDKIQCPLVYADIKALDYSLDELYDLIIEAMKKSPRRCKEDQGGCGALTMDPKTGQSKIPQPWAEDACKKCGARPAPDGFGSDDGWSTGVPGGGGFDKHIDTKKTKQEIIDETVRAAERAKHISQGTLPAGIEGLLMALDEPELSPSDLMVNALHRRILNEGINNDWNRLRRRPTYIYKAKPKTLESGEVVNRLQKTGRLIRPKLYDFLPRWVAGVDTSGSMSDADIAYGVKELKLVASQTSTEGWMVPMDAAPYWDQATQVESKSDIQRFKVQGRGGTVFYEFFRDLSKHYDDLDLVVVITDGWIDNVPAEFAPPCECIWIITSGFEDFQPPFGRKCTLRKQRRGAAS